jgi:hypothetical protein
VLATFWGLGAVASWRGPKSSSGAGILGCDASACVEALFLRGFPVGLKLPFTDFGPDETGQRLRQNFEAIARAGLRAIAGFDIRFGTAQMTGNGTNSQSATVAHRLGRPPRAAFVVAADAAFNGATDTFGDTEFRAVLRHVDNTVWGSDKTYYWIAVG